MKQKKSEMEDIRFEITGAEQNKEKEWEKKKKVDHLRGLWSNVKCMDIQILGVPEGE